MAAATWGAVRSLVCAERSPCQRSAPVLLGLCGHMAFYRPCCQDCNGTCQADCRQVASRSAFCCLSFENAFLSQERTASEEVSSAWLVRGRTHCRCTHRSSKITSRSAPGTDIIMMETHVGKLGLARRQVTPDEFLSDTSPDCRSCQPASAR